MCFKKKYYKIYQISSLLKNIYIFVSSSDLQASRAAGEMN